MLVKNYLSFLPFQMKCPKLAIVQCVLLFLPFVGWWWIYGHRVTKLPLQCVTVSVQCNKLEKETEAKRIQYCFRVH